jgi:hypothetical protein
MGKSTKNGQFSIAMLNYQREIVVESCPFKKVNCHFSNKKMSEEFRG